MAYPNDYYNDDHGPHLHSHDNSHLYIEPDYIANDAKDQLPTLSAIGRGPRGNGIFVQVVDDEGVYKIKILDDVTGHVVAQTPNLEPATISVKPSGSPHDLVPGEIGHADVTVTQDGKTNTYVIDLPPGSPGEKIHIVSTGFIHENDNTYIISGHEFDRDVSINDKVVFFSTNEDNLELVIANVTSVDSLVVVVAEMYIPIIKAYINENGYWIINDIVTATKATVDVIPGTITSLATTTPHISLERVDKDTVKYNFAIPRGTTFTPAIDSNGVISWTNDGGKANPVPVNVKGSKGDTGPQGVPGPTGNTGPQGVPGPAGQTIQIMDGVYREPGSTKDLPDLPVFSDSVAGTAYVVDDDAIDGQYDLYIHGSSTGEPETTWTIVNNWAGVPGPQGEPGIDGVDGDSGSRVFIANLDVPLPDISNNVLFDANVDISPPSNGFANGDMLILVDSSLDWDNYYKSIPDHNGNGRFYGYFSTDYLKFADGSTRIEVYSLRHARVCLGTESRITLVYDQSQNLFTFIGQTPGISPHNLSYLPNFTTRDILAPSDLYLNNPFIYEGSLDLGLLPNPVALSSAYQTNNDYDPYISFIRPVGNAYEYYNTGNTEDAVIDINQQINTYIESSVMTNGVYTASNSVAVEALYGIAGTALGASMYVTTPTDFRTIRTSGVYYVPDPANMLDNPRPEDPVTGKLISDYDNFGIHHTFIGVDSTIYMRHAGTVLTNMSSTTFSPWVQVGADLVGSGGGGGGITAETVMLSTAITSLNGTAITGSAQKLSSGAILVSGFVTGTTTVANTNTNLFYLKEEWRPSHTSVMFGGTSVGPTVITIDTAGRTFWKHTTGGSINLYFNGIIM